MDPFLIILPEEPYIAPQRKQLGYNGGFMMKMMMIVICTYSETIDCASILNLRADV